MCSSAKTNRDAQADSPSCASPLRVVLIAHRRGTMQLDDWSTLLRALCIFDAGRLAVGQRLLKRMQLFLQILGRGAPIHLHKFAYQASTL